MIQGRRLLRMGPSELACRLLQESYKRLEQMRLAVLPEYDETNSMLGYLDPKSIPDGIQASTGLLDYFREVAPSRFFDGAVSRNVSGLLIDQLPHSRDQIVSDAEQILDGRFNLLGYHDLCFGDPVDWHLDPISGHRAPLVHWSRVRFLDPSAVGDSKVTWELNRHQWLVCLGQAYRLTGNERYAEAFSRYVQEWMRANPPGMGINWASSLEVALRLISWCWTLHLFRTSSALSPELFLKMLVGIWAHATHVERYLSYYFSPNTHLTGEALGLFYAGIVFPELRPAKRWRTLGERILIEQIERQTHPDGVYFEQSTCYQRYTVEIYLHFMILASRNGVMIPKAVEERVQRLCDVLLSVRRPDGSMPSVGDADGGWILPLATRNPDDLSAVLSTAAALFARSDLAWGAGGLTVETLWLLGSEGSKAFEAIRRAAPSRSSDLFADGGYVIMRNGWGPDSHQLTFDVGPLGCTTSGGHGHADLLSIQCSIFGEPCLVDPGTYCYTADKDWRNFFRGTAAHSTVMVDGEGQAAPTGPFSWKIRPRARLRRWISEDAFDFADADHDAYSYLSDPVTHRRRVVFVKPRYWVLVDDLEGAAEHQVALRFQFAPMEVTVDRSLWARAKTPGGCGLLIRPFATVPLRADVFKGETDPIQGWVAPDYGQRRPAPVLVYATEARLPLRLVTLLMPTENSAALPPIVTTLKGNDSRLVGVILSDWRESICVDDRDVVIRPVELSLE